MKIQKFDISQLATRVRGLGKLSRKSLVFVAVVALVIVAGVVLAFWRPQETKQAHTVVCPQAVVQRSIGMMQPANSDELKTLVEEIRKDPRYDQEVDCVYIVLNYYINIDDIPNAKTQLANFDKLYKPKKGISPFFNKPSRDIDWLHKQLAFMEKQKAAQEANSKTFNTTIDQ